MTEAAPPNNPCLRLSSATPAGGRETYDGSDYPSGFWSLETLENTYQHPSTTQLQQPFASSSSYIFPSEVYSWDPTLLEGPTFDLDPFLNEFLSNLERERGGVPSDNELSGGSRGVGGDIIVDGLVGSLGAFDDEAVGCRTSLNQADAALAVGSGDPSVSEGMDIEVHKPPSLSLEVSTIFSAYPLQSAHLFQASSFPKVAFSEDLDGV